MRPGRATAAAYLSNRSRATSGAAPSAPDTAAAPAASEDSATWSAKRPGASR